MSQLLTFYRLRAVVLLAVVAFLVTAQPLNGAASGETHATSGALDAARDSVAKIFSRSSDGLGEGSGFIIASDRILTNAHVLQGATEVSVRLPTRASESCAVVSISTTLDLATLRCETGALPALSFSSEVRNGAAVVAIGYPNAGAERVTHGAITDAVPNSMGYLTTDAALDPGNSGGPILDIESGDVVGVATRD